jgi:mRNA-degrading endonuclease RelE of RelBE toxin-antitoxin system
MSYNIKSIFVFEKQAKRLSKKYPSLKKELLKCVSELKTNPIVGIPLGKNCYKLKIAIESKGKGKSGGARIITNFVISDKTVYLLTIYDKSEKDNISNKELSEILKFIPE